MKIRIDDIPEGGSPLSFSGSEDILSESLATVPTPSGVVIDPHIKGNLLVVNEGTKVTITGSIQANMQLQCAQMPCRISSAETTVEFRTRGGMGQGLVPNCRRIRTKIDENTIVIEGSVLDISELIVQEILLEIPMKPLCREDCPGLCPRCGALKGSEECTCPKEAATEYALESACPVEKG